MMTVYAFSNVPPPVCGVTRDLRVLWALEEAGLSYRIHPIDGARGDQRSADYLSVNPFGVLPAIEDDGVTLYESAAILFYIAEKTGVVAQKDAKDRALAAQWAFAAVNTVEPPLVDLFAIDKFYADQEGAAVRRSARVEQAQARLAVLDKELAKRPYLLGNTFAGPDILMTSVLRFIQHTDLLSAVPNVAAYKARCEKRAAWEKVIDGHLKRVGAQ